MKPVKDLQEIFLSGAVYTPQAVKLAAAVFEGRYTVLLTEAPGGLRAVVTGGPCAAGEFANEALNQQCRLDLHAKNYRIASIIATKALLSAAGEMPGKRVKK
jgi:hypothetical protein